jgi:hypothetical protein
MRVLLLLPVLLLAPLQAPAQSVNGDDRPRARDLGIEAYVSATFRSAAVTQRTRLDGYLRETFAYLFYRVFRA